MGTLLKNQPARWTRRMNGRKLGMPGQLAMGDLLQNLDCDTGEYRGKEIIPAVFLDTFGIDIDGAQTNGGGIIGGATSGSSEMLAAGYCKVYDGSDTTNGPYANVGSSSDLDAFTNDDQLVPDSGGTDGDGDALYVGNTTKFAEVGFDISGTVGAYSNDAVAWKYWNGSAWSALTLVLDNTDDGTGSNDGAQPFTQDGVMLFVPPSDWATREIDGVTAYWLQATFTAANVNTAAVMATDKRPYLPIPSSTYLTCPRGGLITDVSLHAHTNSGSNNDTKIVLWNVTQGTFSSEETWAKANQNIHIDLATSLAVDEGDMVAIVCTAEDGSTEYADVHAMFTFGPEAS